jgi:hypothetical protein
MENKATPTAIKAVTSAVTNTQKMANDLASDTPGARIRHGNGFGREGLVCSIFDDINQKVTPTRPKLDFD